MQTAKEAKIFSAAIAATADGQQTGREGEEKIKLHTHAVLLLRLCTGLSLQILVVYIF